MTKKQKKLLKRIIVAACLTVLAMVFAKISLLSVLLSVAAYFVVGYDILKKAWHGLRARQGFDENFLMAVATVGAFLLKEYTEATAVMLFYQIGELFQSYAVGKSRKNISALMDIRPDYANITDEKGNLIQVSPEEVAVGTVITVRPGEKIPLDGVVLSGSSTIDTASLTGESLPREAEENSKVASGCINLTGVLQIRTEKEFSESTVARILELVETASSRKSKSEKFISKFSRYYTPVVCYSALALAVLPPILAWILYGNANLSQWLYRALSFLVISCPCALVVSVPLSFFAAIGGAGKAGILVKGAGYLETLSQVKQVAFDKTGTLTQGVFQVTNVCPNGVTQEELLEIAALSESFSHHPIGQSIVSAYGKEPDEKRVANLTEQAGFGITCEVDGKSVAVGNEKLMKSLGISVGVPFADGTVVHVAKEGEYLGALIVSDTIKPEAKEAIIRLKQQGVRNTVMLTGDHQSVGKQVGKQLGLDKVYAELLPGDKVGVLEELMQQQKSNEKTAYAGDGINDAPVLTRSDVGIAMGAMGSDAALEAADVVLMDDNPLKIAKAIAISKRCMKIVYQNIIFAIGIKVLCLILGALGKTNMWMAIFADVGVMVLAVLNAVRNLKPIK